jgi:alpha-beta hydrolase superfamily lysophospholipase
VLVHGLGEHSGRYEAVADALTEAGYAVWALDHRGHGRSDGRRGHVERFSTFVADLETFRLLVRSHQGGPQVLLGHSLGGAIAFAHALGRPEAWTAVVLSGPAVGITDPPPTPLVLVGKLLSAVAPTARTLGLDATGVSRDPAVVAAYEADPLVHHHRYTARLAGEVFGRVATFVDEAPAFTLPLLVVHGTEDALVGIDASRQLLAVVGSADKELREYPGLHHEVFNEPEGAEVLADVLAWLDTRVPAGRARPGPAAR